MRNMEGYIRTTVYLNKKKAFKLRRLLYAEGRSLSEWLQEQIDEALRMHKDNIDFSLGVESGYEFEYLEEDENYDD